MISVLFFYYNEKSVSLKGDRYPLPKYLGIIHGKNQKEINEIIEKNRPSSYKMASSIVTGTLASKKSFLIDLGTHRANFNIQS